MHPSILPPYPPVFPLTPSVSPFKDPFLLPPSLPVCFLSSVPLVTHPLYCWIRLTSRRGRSLVSQLLYVGAADSSLDSQAHTHLSLSLCYLSVITGLFCYSLSCFHSLLSICDPWSICYADLSLCDTGVSPMVVVCGLWSFLDW